MGAPERMLCSVKIECGLRPSFGTWGGSPEGRPFFEDGRAAVVCRARAGRRMAVAGQSARRGRGIRGGRRIRGFIVGRRGALYVSLYVSRCRWLDWR